MSRLFTLVLVILALVSTASGQDRTEIQKQINISVGEKNYLLAIEQLRAFQQNDLKIFELNNYDYLLARMLEQSGNSAGAMAAYQNAAQRGSILKPYCLWHLSHIARTSGNLVLERLYLQELVAFSPDSRLRPAAQNRLARSYFENRNFESAITVLNSLQPNQTVTLPAEISVARENLVLLGKSLSQLGRASEARGVFAGLLDHLPNAAQPDDFALQAAEGLDQIDRAASTRLSDLEHLRRASIYQFNRDFERAREHYKAIIVDYPQSGITPDSEFQIGRGYAQGGELTEAVSWFERLQEEFPEHESAKDALLQMASAYSRLAKYKEAVARYKKFIDKYPDDERTERAYLNIIDVLRDQGEENDALTWSAKVQGIFAGKLPETLARFSDARLYIARGDWDAALATLDRLAAAPDLGGTRVPGGTSIWEVTFLRGFALENLERYPEAMETYLSIPDGRSEYYGGRATERLRSMAVDPKARSFVEQKVLRLVGGVKAKDAEATRKDLQSIIRLTDSEGTRREYLSTLRTIYKSLPAYGKLPILAETTLGRTRMIRDVATPGSSIGDELFFLGLCDEAAPELQMDTKLQGPAISYSLAKCFLNGYMANRAVSYIEPLWKNVPSDYQIELIPKDQLEMLYPAPYTEALLKYAPVRSIDPRFVLSIIRQESRYRADVKSYAAARGLMQFIPSTANSIAAKINNPGFSQDELYEPSTAILFGSQYLSDLFSIFPNQPPAVAASYNAGDDNMKRWLIRSRSNLPDQYVSEIVFSQSKDYVSKVMANYRIYLFLYDDNLKIKN